MAPVLLRVHTPPRARRAPAAVAVPSVVMLGFTSLCAAIRVGAQSAPAAAQTDTVRLTLVMGADTVITLRLRPQAAMLVGVTVSAARGGERRVSEEPIRVEVISREDIEEKTAMQPGNVAMRLNETSGVRVADTSPALDGVNVRVQGLRGCYTQL